MGAKVSNVFNDQMFGLVDFRGVLFYLANTLFGISGIPNSSEYNQCVYSGIYGKINM